MHALTSHAPRRRAGWIWSDTRCLRAMLRDTIRRWREPRTAAEAFAAVVADFGSVCERRLWRALRWLVQRGEVAAIGTRHSGSRYMLMRSSCGR